MGKGKAGVPQGQLSGDWKAVCWPLAQGLTQQQISRRTGRSLPVVSKLLNQAARHLGLRDVAELKSYLVRNPHLLQ